MKYRMHIFLDTNILISYLFSDESFHEESVKILNQKTWSFYTGPFSILEFKSKIGELWRDKKIQISSTNQEKIENLSDSQQVKILSEICLLQLPIEIITTSIQEKVQILTKSYLMDVNLCLALKLAHLLKLKAPDLIQIASAINIKIGDKANIEYFLTNDMKILKLAQQIYQIGKILPISSRDLIQI
jgi:predicted nucleic acid-binding protein